MRNKNTMNLDSLHYTYLGIFSSRSALSKPWASSSMNEVPGIRSTNFATAGSSRCWSRSSIVRNIPIQCFSQSCVVGIPDAISYSVTTTIKLHLMISVHQVLMLKKFYLLSKNDFFLPDTKYFSSADSSNIPFLTHSRAACRNVSRRRMKIPSHASRSAFLRASFSCGHKQDKHEYDVTAISRTQRSCRRWINYPPIWSTILSRTLATHVLIQYTWNSR